MHPLHAGPSPRHCDPNASEPFVDAETGFVYLRARYYDPATGQFISVDPLYTLTRSRYGYVNGNPLNAWDPTGLGSPPPTPTYSLQALARQNAGCPADPAYPASGISGWGIAGLSALGAVLGVLIVFAPEVAALLAGASGAEEGATDLTSAASISDVQQTLSALTPGRSPGVWTVGSRTSCTNFSIS